MFLLYFLLWVIFNGNFTPEIAILGLVAAAALFAFTCRFMNYSVGKERKLYRNAFRLLRCAVVLVIEIVKANFAVVRLILSEEEETEPVLVTFRAKLRSSIGRSLLANAITLTPGTITVLLEDDTYTVHCLDESMAEGMESSVFVDMLEEIEKCENA